MIKALVLVGFGGGIGSVFRYLTSLLTEKYTTTHFPLATFIVNIIGCLIIGMLIGYFEQRTVVNSDLKFLFITGFCGGFTTFSTFSADSLRLFEMGNVLLAILYIAFSVIIGLIAVWGGMILIK